MRTLCCLLVMASFLPASWPAFGLAAPGDVPPATSADRSPLPGTEPLTWTGDIASRMVEGVDRFLLSETAKSLERRAGFWHRDTSSPARYEASIGPNRSRLKHILGVRDKRVPFDKFDALGSVCRLIDQWPVDSRDGYRIYYVRWPAFGDVTGEGLLLVPEGKLLAEVIAIPDADQGPDTIAAALGPSQFARRLAESGCRVLVPVLVSRRVTHHNLSNREFLYRSAYELGRHIAGYEVQKVLAGVDWFAKENPDRFTTVKIGVIGYGEGGMLALYAGALDPRIRAVCVSGYFGSRQNVWQEPIYRNVFGLLEQFGDAELAAMIAPRGLVIEAAKGPELVVPPGTGGGPGRLVTPAPDEVRAEVARAKQLCKGLEPAPQIELVESGGGSGPSGCDEALKRFLDLLSPGAKLKPQGQFALAPEQLPDADARQARQVHENDRHNQWLLTESPYVRQDYFAKLDTSSPAAFQKSITPYRDYFYNEVIGRFDQPLLAPRPRTRKSYEGKNWAGYEVALDVFPDVFAYGVLLVPKDLKPGQRRPVVVCQHGLEGRPTDVFLGDSPYYHDFAARLADQGFVTFAPQNLYLFGDRFRSLQRKANPIKKTLYSIIVPQHQQIVDWLGGLPFVDRQRIAFYGLSYGGKTAMRVPPLVAGYCLSICSGDFNDWVWKCASTRSPYSYVWTGEYEIFEFDLGSTFNYAEMAALIAPRPFMVERGHFDGVAPDEAVAAEFAKVRLLYEAKLGLTDRCRIEWFVGPHTIHGRGTFDFLHQQLAWPGP